MTTIAPSQMTKPYCAHCDGWHTDAASCKEHQSQVPMSIMSRELRLKLALAKILKDEIEVTDLVNFKWACGEYAGEIIRDTEWDYIVRKCYEVTDQKVGCFYPDHWLRFGEGLLIQLDIDWDTPCSLR